ncbi:FAD-dependent monooxygenase andE [Metarhizium brunneum]|uniref:FAD-dependent monooxygenase andE n=1 Tax=Metarhizium brunneum TaxID=500148 RepID=A0A7D5UXP1_9HYPO
MTATEKIHETKPRFRVLISGGGVAGLTLANALQHARINYLLLEARSNIAPQLGASIGLGPNGSRILDQLGCYDEIMALTQPIHYTGSHYGNTGDYIRPKTDAFQLVQARSNYCMCFLDRQSILAVLAKRIIDKRVLLNKKITVVDHYKHGVRVTCQDGTCYEGDVLVGADGNYSITRREMWRAADQESPGTIPESEKHKMSAEYKCMFGISAPIPELTPRSFDVTYNKDMSPIVIVGKHGRVYWFLIARMPQVFKAGNIPRFSDEEARAFAEEHLDQPLMPGALVKVRDLWERREAYNMVALEEAYYDHWTYGNFALVGDSAHKMTPNMGSGGNSAIESAAALANSLVQTLDGCKGTRPTRDEIQSALQRYQNARRLRASRTVIASNLVTRLHAVKDYLHHFAAHHILPNAGDLLVDLASENWIGAVKLEYMAVPKRSLAGTMPFNPQQGMGNNENILFRALAALPLLFPVALRYCLPLYTPKTLLPWQKLLDESFDVPCLNVEVADFGTVYAVILIEAARRANLMTPLALPLLFGMGCQLAPAETFLSLYFFTYAALVPISRFKAGDLRLTDLSYTRSVLPATLLCYYLPYILSISGPSREIRQASIWAFRLSPLLTSLAQRMASKFIFPSTIQQDRLTNVRRDMGTIRLGIGGLALLSASSWLRLFRHTPSLMSGNLASSSHAWFAGVSILWITYLYNDLKGAGMVRHGWLSIVSALAVSTCSVGPGATVAMAWLYREHVLATKRHKGAIV